MEDILTSQDRLPWYKDADATRIAVGVGYLVVLVSIMVFVTLTWRDLITVKTVLLFTTSA